MNLPALVALGLFLVVFILIVTERLNKTVVALLGAAVFLLMQLVHREEAFRHVDWEVIFVLVSMMIVVNVVQKTGIFQWAAIKLAKSVEGNPVLVMIGLFLLTGLFSAFLDNVTTILILAPISILIAVELGLNPVPFLVIQALGSNIGGAATLIGDPPNIMIGLAAGLAFSDFLIWLGPIVLVILFLSSIILFFLFSGRLKVTNERKARIMDMDENRAITDPVYTARSLSILGLVLLGFLLHDWLHIPIFAIAMGGAATLLLFEKHEQVRHTLENVEWETIFFFIGLFLMVGGLVDMGVIEFLAKEVLDFTRGNLVLTGNIILWASGLLSGVVDNIPYVATMIPLVKNIQGGLSDPTLATPLWWALALGACLGGNLTLVGASANVVAAGMAQKGGYRITFVEFLKYGLGFGLLSLAISWVYLLAWVFPSYAP